MLTLDEIKHGLADRKLTVVAESTGLHYNTVRAYALGTISRPSHDAISKLTKYLTKSGA